MKFAGEFPTIGEGPGIWLGEFQVAVTGDLPGDVSSLIVWVAGKGPIFKVNGVFGWLAVTNPLGWDSCAEAGNCAFLLNCDRCFSRERNMPSFVNGLGNTSFIPATVSE